jgi:hypothetical protein
VTIGINVLSKHQVKKKLSTAVRERKPLDCGVQDELELGAHPSRQIGRLEKISGIAHRNEIVECTLHPARWTNL